MSLFRFSSSPLCAFGIVLTNLQICRQLLSVSVTQIQIQHKYKYNTNTITTQIQLQHKYNYKCKYNTNTNANINTTQIWPICNANAGGECTSQSFESSTGQNDQQSHHQWWSSWHRNKYKYCADAPLIWLSLNIRILWTLHKSILCENDFCQVHLICPKKKNILTWFWKIYITFF